VAARAFTVVYDRVKENVQLMSAPMYPFAPRDRLTGVPAAGVVTVLVVVAPGPVTVLVAVLTLVSVLVVSVVESVAVAVRVTVVG
jgi:hypothetical protein